MRSVVVVFVTFLFCSLSFVKSSENSFDCRKSDLGGYGEFYLKLYKTQNHVVLTNVPFGIWLSFSCFYGYDNETETYINWPNVVNYSVTLGPNSVTTGTIQNVRPHKEYYLSGLSVSSPNVNRVYVAIDLEGVTTKYVKVNPLPGWCSIIPPALAIGSSIITHQVPLLLVFCCSLSFFSLSSSSGPSLSLYRNLHWLLSDLRFQPSECSWSVNRHVYGRSDKQLQQRGDHFVHLSDRGCVGHCHSQWGN